jgi:PPOX class probable F420-dependent enzyme
VNAQEITASLAASHIAVVATVHRHGTPHLTPNGYRYDGKVLTFIARTDRLKYLNLQRDPRISVCMYDPPVASNDVVISGTATWNDQDIWDEARRTIARYRAPDQVDGYLARWHTAPRVLITVTPEHIATRRTSSRSAAVKAEALRHDRASGPIGLRRHGEATAAHDGVGHPDWELMVHHVGGPNRMSMRRRQAGRLSPVALWGRPLQPTDAARPGPGSAACPAIARS